MFLMTLGSKAHVSLGLFTGTVLRLDSVSRHMFAQANMWPLCFSDTEHQKLVKMALGVPPSAPVRASNMWFLPEH